MNRILGLDCSSVAIGFAVLVDQRTVEMWGTYELNGPIEQRVQQAHEKVALLLRATVPRLVVIESPASRFNGALIPQCRVSGGVLLALCEAKALWTEVAPTAAKKIATGKGTASKEEVLRAVVALLGATVKNYVKRNGKVCAIDGDDVVITEDAADAVSVALAGARVPVVNSLDD